MTKYIDLAKLTGGKITDCLFVCSKGYMNSYNWGYKATLLVNGHIAFTAKMVCQNRTWEAYPHQTVIYSVLSDYVVKATGYNPNKNLCNRDSRPMKSEAAEARRMGRVAAYNAAIALYNLLTGIVDGVRATPTNQTHQRVA